MVDVSPKDPTRRRAVAEARVRMQPATLEALVGGTLRKGNPLEVVRLAGIQAAKRTAELIPLCHPVRLDQVDVRVDVERPRTVRLEAEAIGTDRTGVEMEAMCAVSLAALALYDMLKSAERGVQIHRIVLLEKEGGQTGPWRRRGRARSPLTG